MQIALLDRVLHEYHEVGRLVLTTDHDGPRDFYGAAGLVPFAELGLVGFLRT